MNDKSHVSLEQHVCLVCGAAFDTGAILLDRRLRASMKHHTATGWGLCPEHQKLSDDGFVALHAQAYGESVDAVTLIPHMLEAFMAGDRGFRKGAAPPKPG